MDRLPSNIMFDIFSRVPAKCLARFRHVSKEWCEYIDDPYLMIVHDERVLEPIPILYHTHHSRHRRTRSLCFHVLESKQTGTNDTYFLEPIKEPFLEFLRKNPLSKYSYAQIGVLGSCNGLMCFSHYENDALTSLVVVHPLRKECYKVPPLPLRLFDDFEWSFGLGFDASTNTLKMVCVLDKDFVPACTLVHVFGTNSWREIPQVPSYSVTGKSVFANGCLHWLVSPIGIKTEDGGREVIWFDVNKEEFGLIDPPQRICDTRFDDHLVDLNGEVGFVCYETLEVWVLKKKEWVPHCRFEFHSNDCEILGCWNKDGDLLISSKGADGKYRFFVYNLRSGVLHETNIVVPNNGYPNIFMHPNKLSSIRGIGTNSFPMKKTDLKESCQRLLSFY